MTDLERFKNVFASSDSSLRTQRADLWDNQIGVQITYELSSQEYLFLYNVSVDEKFVEGGWTVEKHFKSDYWTSSFEEFFDNMPIEIQQNILFNLDLFK